MAGMLVRRRGASGRGGAQRCLTRRWPGRPARLHSWMNVERKCFIIVSLVVLSLAMILPERNFTGTEMIMAFVDLARHLRQDKMLCAFLLRFRYPQRFLLY